VNLNLLSAQHSFILVIDIQGKLARIVNQGEAIIKRNQWLLSIATELNIPIWFTEQYPQGLGETVEELHTWRMPANTVAKTRFSAYETLLQHSVFAGFLKQGPQRQQVVLTGAESHVCVLQTALDFAHHGWKVFVVADAVASRSEQSKTLALARMREAGIHIVNGEMVAFEWLNDSTNEHFRAISRNYLR